MTPTMSIQLQGNLRQDILEYAENISKGFMPKRNLPAIIAEVMTKSKEELVAQGFKTTLAKKYSAQMVNALAQRVMREINR